jgi:hypothetical protein
MLVFDNLSSLLKLEFVYLTEKSQCLNVLILSLNYFITGSLAHIQRALLSLLQLGPLYNPVSHCDSIWLHFNKWNLKGI